MQTRKRSRPDNLADLLIRCRTEKNLTLENVAASTKLSAMTLSLLERQKGQTRRTTVLKVEEFLRKQGYLDRRAA